MAEAILDSSAYIDLERAGRHPAEEWAFNSIRNSIRYRSIQGVPFMSVVSAAEILKGLHRDANPTKAQAFKQSAPTGFQLVPVDSGISFLAAELMARLEMAGLGIGIADSLIAATAIDRRLVLVTSNTKHFERVVSLGFSLRLSDWRQTAW